MKLSVCNSCYICTMKNIDVNTYNRIHYWLKVSHGKANRCENKECNRISSRFEWALLKGKEHKKDISHYIMMCRSCHAKYDFTENGRKALVEANLGKKHSNETKIKMSESHKKVDKSYTIGNRNSAKLSLENIASIKHELSEGIRGVVLAKRYNVTKQRISQIKKL